jgi:hypothetical protein
MPGIIRSRIKRSLACSFWLASAAMPSATAVTSWPALRRFITSRSRMSAWSSATRIFEGMADCRVRSALSYGLVIWL